MEKETTKPKQKVISKKTFQEAYIKHLLLHDKPPISIFEFTHQLKAAETDFYQYFNSFKILEKSIWQDLFEDVMLILEKDEAYTNYSVREKILAFYFTWFEKLIQHRSYVIYRIEQLSKTDLNPYFLESLHVQFEDFVNQLMIEGKGNNEIAERPLSKQYDKAFWLQFMFLNRFWVADDSLGFEKTDAAIEKSVNLGLDLIGKGAIDSMIDFGKFLFQNKKSL
jgi:hypothetical protein